jgi:hypothetical protein
MHPFTAYLTQLRDIRLSGGAVAETSYYGSLAALLDEAGKGLRPKVRCIVNLRNTGAGIPDGGFFTRDQFPRCHIGPDPGGVAVRGGDQEDGREPTRCRGGRPGHHGGVGYEGAGRATMPGRGRAEERPYTEEERDLMAAGAAALGIPEAEVLARLGDRAIDVYLNERAFWRCVPARVWTYTLGGYQVIKKWLSYREKEVLGRGLRPDEAREVTNVARRIAAILLLESKLDANYRRCAGKE